jgi:hypothetical protein
MLLLAVEGHRVSHLGEMEGLSILTWNIIKIVGHSFKQSNERVYLSHMRM